MARFTKRVVESGLYQTPDGVAEASPARIRHWHETIQGLLQAGHKPPLSWGHLSTAVPHPDEHAYWASRFNAGKVVGSRLEPDGSLVIEGDAPGVEIDADGRLVTQAELPGGTKVKAAIEEVSIGAMDWTDGSGKTWPDAPVHIALTPLPVWVPPGGQPPFEEVRGMAEAARQGATQVQRFGTSTLLARFSAMADDPKKDDDKGGGKKPPEKKDDKGGGGMNIKGIVEALREAGLTIPDEVADDEGLIIAIKASKGTGTPAPDKKEDPKPEEPGAFLSTIRDPLTRGLVEERIGECKARALARIAALEKRGLPGHLAAEYRKQAGLVRFSTGGGKAVSTPVDGVLDALEASLPKAEAPGGFERTFLSSVQGLEEPTPEGAKGEARQQELADLMAKRAGLPSRATTNGK